MEGRGLRGCVVDLHDSLLYRELHNYCNVLGYDSADHVENEIEMVVCPETILFSSLVCVLLNKFYL